MSQGPGEKRCSITPTLFPLPFPLRRITRILITLLSIAPDDRPHIPQSLGPCAPHLCGGPTCCIIPRRPAPTARDSTPLCLFQPIKLPRPSGASSSALLSRRNRPILDAACDYRNKHTSQDIYSPSLPLCPGSVKSLPSPSFRDSATIDSPSATHDALPSNPPPSPTATAATASLVEPRSRSRSAVSSAVQRRQRGRRRPISQAPAKHNMDLRSNQHTAHHHSHRPPYPQSSEPLSAPSSAFYSSSSVSSLDEINAFAAGQSSSMASSAQQSPAFSSAPLPSPSLQQQQRPSAHYFASMPLQGAQLPMQHPQQPQQHMGGAFQGQRGDGGGTPETAPFLKDFSLLAEAAKRAQMACLMRDLSDVEL